MRQLLLTTILLDLLGCIFLGIFVSLGEGSIQPFLYVAFLTFGSILVPTFIGVLIYRIVKKKVTFFDKTKTLISQILVMLLLMAIGILLWALIDVFIWYEQVTFENIKNDFRTQFSGFLIAGIFMAIAIPFLDTIVRKKDNASKPFGNP